MDKPQMINLNFITDPEEILRVGMNQKQFTLIESPTSETLSNLNISELIKIYKEDDFVNKQLIKKLKSRLKQCYMVDNKNRYEVYKNIALIDYHKKLYPDYYSNILSLKNYPTYNDSTIEKDVKRTTPKLKEINREEFQAKLRRILIAFSRRNQFIGYCQGFNYIIQFLLETGINEEDSFWFFCHLIENIVPPDYYNSMTGVLTDDKILEILIKIKLPRLWGKIQDMGILTSVFSIQWFVCVFTFNLNWEITQIIMDNLLVFGPIIIIKSAFICLELMQDDLCKCADLGQFLMKIDQFLSTNNRTKEFQIRLSQLYINKKVKKNLFQQRCKYLQKASDKVKERILDDKFQQDVKFQAKRIVQQNNLLAIICNPKYPLCVYVREKQKIDKVHLDHFVYRVQEFTIISDYLDNMKKLNQPKNQQRNNMIIGRDHHECMQSTLLGNKSSLISFNGDWETSMKDGQLAQYLNQFNHIEYDKNLSIQDDVQTVKSDNINQRKVIERKDRSPIKDFLLQPIKLLIKDKVPVIPAKKPPHLPIKVDISMKEPQKTNRKRAEMYSPKKYQNNFRMKKPNHRANSPMQTLTNNSEIQTKSSRQEDKQDDFQERFILSEPQQILATSEEEQQNIRKLSLYIHQDEAQLKNSQSILFLADLIVRNEDLQMIFNTRPPSPNNVSRNTSRLISVPSDLKQINPLIN